MRLRLLLFVFAVANSLSGVSQQYFHKEIPPGNYSGICCIGDELYAVVDDKADEDGFYVFRLQTDTVQNKITKVENMGYRSSGFPNRDMEGVCYRRATNTLYVSGETDNEVYEYTIDGRRTGRQLQVPDCFKAARRNLGIESLTYDETAHRFYITTERTLPGDTLLRIETFGDNLKPVFQYLYKPDKPISKNHYYGVAELCATGDGRLLVMERQVKVPRMKIGATTVIRIYSVKPLRDKLLEKTLVYEMKTHLTLANNNFANYEGMVYLGGNKCLLIADSQYRHSGVLRDWFQIVELNN